MPRQTVNSVAVSPNIRALRVYSVEGSRKTIDQLQTVGIKLSKEQAIHLARVLLAVTQEWDSVEITAKRFERRQNDGTFPVTVTSFVDEDETTGG